MRRTSSLFLVAVVALAGCTADTIEAGPVSTTSLAPTTSAALENSPRLVSVRVPGVAATYELTEIDVDLEAVYDNPYDQRQIALDSVFVGPDGSVLRIPGFWDGEDAWRIRFTPTMPGEWSYSVKVTDRTGVSPPAEGSMAVADSGRHGFLRVGIDVDPAYSARYIAYEDGTPWYGRGHADLDMSLGGPAPGGSGLRKIEAMAETRENYEMWWPMWGNNFIQDTYDDYSPAQMGVIDFVVREAEENGISLVFTIWGHQFLRTPAHDWPDERWNFNGFSELTDIEGFFTDAESWAWQENLYRYIIARWSYSSAVMMWQTVTEINGTESYGHTDDWHEAVDDYFDAHDPYRHPTTATKSGAQDWPEGHAVMDVAQVHLYHVFGDNPIADTLHFVEWTRLMWDRAAKPNWIGEYGTRIQSLYPEFMHNANWSSLAAGAAMTPTEWNDQNAFGTFDDAMAADMRRFSEFVARVPLVAYDPDEVTVRTNEPAVRGWGVVGGSGGVVWIQDAALDQARIEDIRSDATVRAGIVAMVNPLQQGSWTVTPYDTWTGVWLDPVVVDCPGGACAVPLPDFHSDIALHLSR